MMADTKEAENFYRLLTLVTDVANATLQEKFISCFPGLSFETILNRKKHNILRLWLPQNKCCCPSGTGSGAGSTGSAISKKSVLHESQCKLMFDYQTASSFSNRNCCCKYVAKTGADPSVLDVTLVTCLLINIANVSASERLIIEKIRTFRNELQGHRNTARISDVDFNRNWSGLSRAIKDLAASCSSSYKSSIQTEIEKLKSKVLDSSFTHHTQHLIQVMYSDLYQEILKKDEEISEMHTKVDQILRYNDELTESMKDLRRNPLVEQRKREIDISTMELDTTLKNSKFIETQAFQFAGKKINSDNLKGPIVFLGLPGDGKTTLALRLTKELMNGHNFHKTKKQPLIIHGVSEYEKVKLIDPNLDLVVFIDDMYGKYSVPRQTEDTWRGCFPHLEACFSDSSSSSSNVLVVAMRKDIYEVCKASFNDLPMFKSSVIIDLTSDDFKLTQEEKMDIFRSYVPKSDIDDNQVQEMCKQSNQIGFPQCCRLYSENKNLQTLKSDFFKYPTIHLKQELKKMLKGIDEERRRFCVLVLIMLHGGCLKVEECFEDSSSEKETQTLKNAAMVCDLQYSENLGNHLLNDAKSFLGVYVKCNDDGGQYRFSHDSVEQTVVNIMFEENAHFMIKNSKFENFSQLSSDPLRGPSVFTPEKHHYKIIIERISNEVKDEQYRAFTTLANIDLWNEKEFREQFSESVRLEEVDESTGDNMSLLECGAKTGNYNLVKYMCSTKPKRDILQKAFDTAGRFGQEKVFFLLSEQGGIVPNIRTFFCVIESGSMTLFRLLLKSNINFNDTCHLDFPFDPISAFQQISLNGNIEMAREFLSRFSRLFKLEHILNSVDIAGVSGSIPFIQFLVDLGADIRKSNVLLYASYGGSLDLVRYLIEGGLKTSQVDSEQRTMLHHACLSGNFELVRYIAEKYPFLLHMVSKTGMGDLHFACEGGSVDIVEYLIKNGADVDHVDADGNTVLQSACLSRKIQVLKYLAENYPHLLHQTNQKLESSLHFACFGSSVDAVRYLIKKGADVNHVAINGRTILHSACFRGKLEVVKYFAENYPHILNMKDERGKTNLHYACNRDSVDVVKYLIKKGENVYHVASDSSTVLHRACFSGKLEIVKYLVENYRDLLHKVNIMGLTSLEHACAGGSVDVVKYLIKNGADVHHVTVDKTTILHSACFWGKLEIVKYLVENYPNFLHMINERGATNLHYACNRGSVDVVEYLIKKGADVNHVAPKGRTILHSACFRGELEVVKYLAEYYPHLLNMENERGETNLHYACYRDSVDVVKYLIKKGANVYHVAADSSTVLHRACFSGKLEIVKYLVENYRDLLHKVNIMGLTSLHHACAGGSVDVVKYLIKNGADVHHHTVDKTTILHCACFFDKLEIVKYLVENYPHFLHMVSEGGMTNLHYACNRGSVDVVEYLIMKGADVNHVDTEMRTVLQCACLGDKLEIVKYLFENYPDLLHLVDIGGMTSLHYACVDGSVNVVKYPIKKFANLNQIIIENRKVLQPAWLGDNLETVKYLCENYPDLLHMVDNFGMTSLHFACADGSVDVVKYLIKKGADVHHVNFERTTVFHFACFWGKLEIVKYLAENYPDLLHMVDVRGETTLHYACEGGSVDVVENLIKNGADVHHVSTDRTTVLQSACFGGKLEVVKYLVDKYPDMSYMVNEKGMTTLHYACEGGSVDVVESRLKDFADVYPVDTCRRKVLRSVCSNNKLEVVKYLVEKCPDLLHMADERGMTSLHYACNAGYFNVVEYLIKKGADVNHVATDGRTVLHSACLGSNLEVVKYLAENYPDLLHLVDIVGMTSLHYACLDGSVNMVKYPFNQFANLIQVTIENRKVLQPACLGDNLEIVKYLCENYPDLLHKVDNIGMTSLHFACVDGSVDVVKYLIKKGADVHHVNLERTTVFHFACFWGKLEIVKYLAENYPDLLYMVDVRGRTNLQYASDSGSVDVFKYLIEKQGIDILFVFNLFMQARVR